MNLTPNAQATLLLTSYFTKASSESAKPLTNAEWGRFAMWLKDNHLYPADLLVNESQIALQNWHDSWISSERIFSLLSRGHSLALAVEKWARAGLWIVTRADADYPIRYKSRLRNDSPAVLFGCGNRSILNLGGLAVVGSRKASADDLIFTEQLGAKAASCNIAIISGGAKGIDESSMLSAMNANGNVIGIMADNLMQAATSQKWRNGLLNGNLALISPYYPEAGFSAGNAMARNKYIYCLADSSIVIHSGKKGGTINGAEENLKKQWVPLWVKPTIDPDAANESLVRNGGLWCSNEAEKLDILELMSDQSSMIKDQQDLFSS